MYDINSLSPCNSYTIEVVGKIPVSSPRANLFPGAKPKKIYLLEGNWNLPNAHNGIL